MNIEITEDKAFLMGIDAGISDKNPFVYGYPQYEAFATGILTQVIMRAGARLAAGVSMVDYKDGKIIDYTPILTHVMDADATCQN